MNWSLALPEIVLACAGMVLLVAGVVWRSHAFTVACSGTLGAFFAGGLLVFMTGVGHGYSDLLVVDAFARFAQVLILIAGALGVLLAMDWTRQEHLRRFEFPLLMLFSTVGMMLMVSAASLMTLYMGIELMSLPIYVLAAFARDNLRSAEAGLKYFVLGALASGLLLYGISLVYGFAGTTEFATISVALVRRGANAGDRVHGNGPEGRCNGVARPRHGRPLRPPHRPMAVAHLLGCRRLDVAWNPGRHRAKQYQAADGIFLDRSHGLCADRACCR
jgi:NADH-quinone oxidoreductase subunit N